MTQIITRCKYTKKNLLEIQKALTKRSAKICTYISLGGGVMAGVGLWIGHGELIYFGFFWFILFWFWRYHTARKTVKAAMKHYQKLYGCEVETELKFYATMFIAKNLQAETERRVSYDEVSKVVYTNNLCALVMEDNLAFLIDRRELDEDAQNELFDLLNEKCTLAMVNI